MKHQGQSARRLFICASGLGLLLHTTLLGNQLANGATAVRDTPASHPSTEGMTGETVFANLLEHNRMREYRLHQYSVTRTYQVKNDKGKVRAEAQVLLQYRAPDSKEFKILSEKGSGIVRNRVFKPLMESEVETASGRNRHDSSITPANYDFELLGEEDFDGYHCFAVHASPKRRDKYLFEGRILIEASEFAIVKIAGQPAKNPSFWTKRVDFVRRYQKIGESWLPFSDESITQVRIFGKNIFTIDYQNYEVLPGDPVTRALNPMPTYAKD